MLNILKSLFGGEKQSSRDIARDRLKVVLIHDHANITPEVMEHLREDIIQVISKYMIIDKNDMQVALDNDANSVALVANIPVRKMKHFR